MIYSIIKMLILHYYIINLYKNNYLYTQYTFKYDIKKKLVYILYVI